MFLDEAIIDVSAGKGGSGMVHWRREKYIARGGPDGGDGGRGADVYIQADAQSDTLSNYASKKVYKGENGKDGGTQRKTGKSSEPLYLKVPPGTLIYDLEAPTPLLIGDLDTPGDQVLVCAGGRGGFGNTHFKSSVRQRPDFAELGEPGEQKRLKLELKLVADVGIIGYPSVGKSTLISVISAAKPKIAAYEFTTIVPNLGVVTVTDRNFVVCDVPGLIAGAAAGKGLGHQFLRHIERCGLLLHMLDAVRSLGDDSQPDATKLLADYQTIREELTKYSPTLADKKELVVLNKIDLIPESYEQLVKDLKKAGVEVWLPISAATTQGTEQLSKELMPIVLEERDKRAHAEAEDLESGDIAILQPHLESNQMGAYRVEEVGNQIIVHGKRLEQLAVMTDFNNEGAVRRFKDVLDKIGLQKLLRQHEGKTIFVGQTNISDIF